MRGMHDNAMCEALVYGAVSDVRGCNTVLVHVRMHWVAARLCLLTQMKQPGVLDVVRPAEPNDLHKKYKAELDKIDIS